ncbi:MAG: hypothetical protein HQ515_11440 [Phycisphaeraceae bacterium]|nr:hypothetical protein [Phycisphaeraceae bacterium]
MYQKLASLDIPVMIFAPYGTSRHELTDKFFQQSLHEAGPEKGSSRGRINPNWIALLEAIYQLEHQLHANPVGRTIFQKICYTLTEAGVDTGFRFKQGSYGPFSAEVKQALATLANANLIHEQQLGRMTAIRTGPEFLTVRAKYGEALKANNDAVQKTVDLFSRIKNTDQAEEVTTVFFMVRRLQRQGDGSTLTEQDVYDAVLEWKKHWDTPEKHSAIAAAVRNLMMLGWMKVQFSESLPVEQMAF